MASTRPPTSSSLSYRPTTGQSRPNTGRPLTAASSRHEGSYVVAVLESRGVGREVGIAALDKDTGHVELIQVREKALRRKWVDNWVKQLADCQTYVKTLHHLHLHYPALVLVPDTFLAPIDSSAPSSAKNVVATSLLVQCIQEEFPGVPIEPVLRKYWNEEAGTF
jgi:DNA mismatch repair protein MSH4